MDKTLEALIIKTTVKALPTKISRRKYLKTLGIKYNSRSNSFEKISGGAADIEYEDLICPITQCIFIQPVVAADGFTYEKSSLDRLDMYPIRTSSGVVLTHRNYIPNMMVRNTIYNLLSQMETDPRVKRFFEENYNRDLADELGIPIFTIPAIIPNIQINNEEIQQNIREVSELQDQVDRGLSREVPDPREILQFTLSQMLQRLRDALRGRQELDRERVLGVRNPLADSDAARSPDAVVRWGNYFGNLNRPRIANRVQDFVGRGRNYFAVSLGEFIETLARDPILPALLTLFIIAQFGDDEEALANYRRGIFGSVHNFNERLHNFNERVQNLIEIIESEEPQR